jgi:hypothetical protein
MYLREQSGVARRSRRSCPRRSAGGWRTTCRPTRRGFSDRERSLEASSAVSANCRSTVSSLIASYYFKGRSEPRWRATRGRRRARSEMMLLRIRENPGPLHPHAAGGKRGPDYESRRDVENSGAVFEDGQTLTAREQRDLVEALDADADLGSRCWRISRSTESPPRMAAVRKNGEAFNRILADCIGPEHDATRFVKTVELRLTEPEPPPTAPPRHRGRKSRSTTRIFRRRTAASRESRLGGPPRRPRPCSSSSSFSSPISNGSRSAPRRRPAPSDPRRAGVGAAAGAGSESLRPRAQRRRTAATAAALRSRTRAGPPPYRATRAG